MTALPEGVELETCIYDECKWPDVPAPYNHDTWVYVHEWCSTDWAKRSATARAASLVLHPRDTSPTAVVDDDDQDKLRARGVIT